jgi:aminodeoxyfutalosine deaminase
MSRKDEKISDFAAAEAQSAEARPTLFRAAAIFDAGGHKGAAMLLEWGSGDLPRVLAVGTPDEVSAHPAAAAAETIDLPTSVIIPGLVNAHTHLDLTHIGPRPYSPADGFLNWIDMIRASRRHDEHGVAESVRRGIELSLAGGTVAVGDIAGGLPGEAGTAAWRTLQASPLIGTCYTELFGIGNRRQAGSDRLQVVAAALQPSTPLAVRLGIQPHAPYSVDRRLYEKAADLASRTGAPIATHLAESPEEDDFVRNARGPFRELLERLGFWDESITELLGRGLHPARHLEPVLGRTRFLAAHVNDASDGAMAVLARTRTSVAYCPRASSYFSAHEAFGPHRYQEMVGSGINVALGTDSIVNLPQGSDRMSTWDEMRFLYRRDRTDPLLLLRMATANGATALGLPDDWFRIRPGGELAGAVAVPIDPGATPPLRSTWNAPPAGCLSSALIGEGAPGLLFIRRFCCYTGQTWRMIGLGFPTPHERQMDSKQAVG